MTETTIDTPAGDDGSRILSLFRDWMTAIRAASAVVETDERAWEAACDRADKIEAEIFQTPAISPAGLAIKTYLVVRDDDTKWRADPTALSGQDLGDRARALLRDAAHLVPELVPLVTTAAIKVAPPAKAAAAAGRIDAAAPEITEADGVPADRLRIVCGECTKLLGTIRAVRALTNADYGEVVRQVAARHPGWFKPETNPLADSAPIPGSVERRSRVVARHARIASLAQATSAAADPVLALVIKRYRLWEECNSHSDVTLGEDAFGALVSKTGEASDALDEQIADMVATTPAGLTAQVELLADDEDVIDEDLADRLLASVRAGIRGISPATGKRDGATFRSAEAEIAEANRLAKRARNDEELQLIYQRHEAAADLIELTEPQSLAAVAVKLRRLFGSGGALDGFDGEIDSVRQCIAFLDREIAAQARRRLPSPRSSASASQSRRHDEGGTLNRELTENRTAPCKGNSGRPRAAAAGSFEANRRRLGRVASLAVRGRGLVDHTGPPHRAAEKPARAARVTGAR
jgi:hypothetical protein